MQSASRPRSSPATTRVAKSPSGTSLSSRPPFSLYSRNNGISNRDDSPSTSRHQLQRAVSPTIQQQRTRSPVVSRQPVAYHTPSLHFQHQNHTQQIENWSLPATPSMNSGGGDGAGEQQLELFGKLQQVVVQLTHSAADEKSKLIRMQQRIDSYDALVKDQDRMICELRAMNARLQKEKDALASFRQQPGMDQHSHYHEIDATPTTHSRLQQQQPSSRGFQQLVAPLYHQDESIAGGSAVTPKTKSFVQSLVDQLKDEKRLRYQVEEQSSRMIGEQQLTIHRLEDRLTVRNNGGSSPAGGRSPRASVGATARGSGVHSMLHSPGDDDAHRYDPRPLMVEAIRAYTNPSPSDDGPSVRVTVGDDQPPSARSMSSSDAGASSLSMENASALLQQIKLRHGL
jgi:hypothetical protein